MRNSYRLVISCPDQVGIVAAVSRFVADKNGWLLEASYHSEAESGEFFMRNEIKADSLNVSLDEFRQQFQLIADEYGMTWQMIDSSKKKKMVIFASHASHCLADLLHRWHSHDLYCDIPVVISNHENLRDMVEWHGIPFEYVAINKENKAEANQKIEQLIEKYDADLIVLARYMQIIPEALCEVYAGRMINIHHSFLPSFVGANPYKRAYERGVKLIGATCHYVTAELDEGPIIEQDVIRVSHRHSKDDMERLGKDAENRVLASGVRMHLEDRVIISDSKTVILE